MKWLVLLVLVACQSKTKTDDKPKDPWAETPKGEADAPPTLGERARLANEACPRVTNPPFFEVKKAGHTSHILGTRHLSVGLDKFPQVVRDQLDAAALVMFEIPPDDMVAPKLAAEPLRSELGDADWTHYATLVGQATARRLEQQSALVGILALIAMYEDPGTMLDKQLQARVAEKKIQASGFETAAFQVFVLGKLLDAKLLKALVEETPDRAHLKQHAHDGIERYCTGVEREIDMLDGVDPANLAKHGYTPADVEHYKETLLYNRNADWVPKLEKLFEYDRVFVAVGAGHLQGPRGVIEMLKKDGYEVTRINR